MNVRYCIWYCTVLCCGIVSFVSGSSCCERCCGVLWRDEEIEKDNLTCAVDVKDKEKGNACNVEKKGKSGGVTQSLPAGNGVFNKPSSVATQYNVLVTGFDKQLVKESYDVITSTSKRDDCAFYYSTNVKRKFIDDRARGVGGKFEYVLSAADDSMSQSIKHIDAIIYVVNLKQEPEHRADIKGHYQNIIREIFSRPFIFFYVQGADLTGYEYPGLWWFPDLWHINPSFPMKVNGPETLQHYFVNIHQYDDDSSYGSSVPRFRGGFKISSFWYGFGEYTSSR